MKKLMSLITALVMVLSLSSIPVSAAVFPDVAGTSCESAVTVLTGLRVINGYEDGTYRPDRTVSRAEIAKLIVSIMGKTSLATSTTPSFYDMDTAVWSIPYVEYAVTKGIINGYGDGRYGPSNPVKYNEALKMIVCALGYTTDCSEIASGSYPDVYVNKANELGITKGLNFDGENGANRGDIAIMLYNALSAANVYAGLDGSTICKPGSTSVTFRGETVSGTNWLDALNTSGGSEYMVIGAKDLADTSLSDRVGLAAEVFTDSADYVLMIMDDSITQLLKGTISSDGTTFTADGKDYSLANAAMKKFIGTGNPAPMDTAYVPYFYKGVLSSTIDNARNYSGHVAFMKDGKIFLGNSSDLSSASNTSLVTGNCTLTVRMDQDQITEIWAVNSTPDKLSGQTTGWEVKSSTNPVVYWTIENVKENDTVTLTLNATENGSYGFMFNDNPNSEHVLAMASNTLNAGNNTVTLNLGSLHLSSGETTYLHLGFDTVSGAHMVTTIPVKNTNS